ncbi:MAG TPA: glycosyltransferase family 87 protein [Candidatus Limnocylindria bacterium]|nr:glycosyltransferase family 87 protein [Candidatus Limnocylindria bacterium]
MRRLSVLAVPALLALAAAFVSIDIVREPRLTDFFCFWTAARLVISGEDPYDPNVWSEATSVTIIDRNGRERSAPCPGRSGYPLTTSVALAPFGALPLAPAATLWQALLIGGALCGTVLIWRALGYGPGGTGLFSTLVFASQPFAFTLITAQFGGLLLGLVGIALALEATRPRLAGAVFALLALKPHVVALALLALPLRWLSRGPRAAVVGAALVGVALLVVSLALRPSWPLSWLGELGGHRLGMTEGTPTVWSLASIATGDTRPGIVVIAALAAVYAFALRGRPIATVDVIAIALVGTLLISPYAGGHDQLLLAPAWGAVLAAAFALIDWRRMALLVAILLCASVLPWVLYADALLNRPNDAASGLVIIATALVHAASLATRPARV